MLSRIGIQTRVEALPMNAFLGKVRKEETALSLLGWGSFAGDLALRSLLAGVTSALPSAPTLTIPE